MKNEVKNIVVTVVFSLFIAFFVGMCGYNYLHPAETSEAERRPLAQFPEKITWEGILDKTVIDEFEKYSVDQFPFREFFRGVKAKFQMNVLNLKENNGLAVEDGYIVKIEQDFKPENVEYSIGKLEYVYNTYIKDKAENMYLAVIPDKNYFLAKDYGYISPDYETLIEQLRDRLSGMEYIDLFDVLTLEDYYKTDTHWRQDRLGNVMDKLGGVMGFKDRISGNYEYHTYDDFKGVYYGQSALNPKPDQLTYLTNEVLDACKVYDYLEKTRYGIYNYDLLTGKDGYEFFLSGTKALLRIDNPKATTDKSLVIFRDSYGSSIAPLIAEGYKSVYVVDIRYAAPMTVAQMIDFEGKDVLFLYSALILNSMSFSPFP